MDDRTDLRNDRAVESVLDDPENLLTDQEKTELFGVPVLTTDDSRRIINEQGYSTDEFTKKFEEGKRILPDQHAGFLGGVMIYGPNDAGELFVRVGLSSRGQNNINKRVRNDRARLFITADSRSIIQGSQYLPAAYVFKTFSQQKANEVRSKLAERRFGGTDIALTQAELITVGKTCS